MYAVIMTGGKQYRVKEGDVLSVEKLDLDPGRKAHFDRVLLIEDGETVQVGTPVLDNAMVLGLVLENYRDEKVIVFKKKRRKQYVDAMREWNHRVAYGAAQMLTRHWGTAITAPESMYGSMVTIPLPERFGTTPQASAALKDALLYEDNIEAQILPLRDRLWLRIAAQVYNEPADYERLRDAMDRRG